MPATVAACRVCLATDVRLLSIAGSLQLVYEKITNNVLHAGDGRPAAACYVCHAQLDKCRRLMQSAALAENVLNVIAHRHSLITEKSLSLVDREANRLCGSLRCSGAECYNIEVPDPAVVKAEPELFLLTGTGNEKLEDPLQPEEETNTSDTDGDSDEEYTVSQSHCVTVTDTREDEKLGEDFIKVLGHDVSPAPSSGPVQSNADNQEQAEGCTINRKQSHSLRESTTLTAQGPHECVVCQQRFKQIEHLKLHYRSHTKEKPYYQCEVCQERFNQKRILVRHLKTHSKDKHFQCNDCGKSFQNLKVHTAKKFQCEVCQRVLCGKSRLLSHIRSHTEEKPFPCEVCGRRYSHKSNLGVHLKSHTGVKPLQCEVCHKPFEHKGNLKIHIRIHTGERPFQCGVCQRRFITNTKLLLHSRSHTGEKQFQCFVCGLRYSRKSNLLVHSRTHTGEKPFECEVCLRQFKTKSIMTRHLRVHNDVKPFTCEVCHKAFSQRSNLSSHIKTHTSNKPRTSGPPLGGRRRRRAPS